VAYAQEPPALTRAWQTVGGVLADGLDLLLWQAVDQVRLMTGCEPEVEPMRVALRAAAAG
jgi:shikimate dehydrogenase